MTGARQEDAGEQKCRQRKQKAIEPCPANSRGIAFPRALVIGHIFRCGDRGRRGSGQALGGLRNVAVAAAENFADQQSLDFIDAHVLERLHGGRASE